jgi:hypothetical protein
MGQVESKTAQGLWIRSTAALCVSAAAVLAVRAFIRPAAAGEVVKLAPASDDVKYFDEQVKPLLQANCLKCHGGEAKIKGGLQLTTRDSILKGGDDGQIITLDAPEKSLLVSAINYGGGLKTAAGKDCDIDPLGTARRRMGAGARSDAGQYRRCPGNGTT